MSNELVETIGTKEVSNIDAAFSEKRAERQAMALVYESIIGKEVNASTAKEARELRLKAVKVKSGVAKIHKSQKEFALAFGKYCDAWKRKETEPIQQMIDGLIEIEKFEERLEAERRDKLQAERVLEVSKFIDQTEIKDFTEMDQDVWRAFVSAKETIYHARLEEERKLEADRVAKIEADRKERVRIETENKRLREEAETRAKEEADRKRIEAAKLAKAKEAEAKARAEAEKAKAEAQRAAKIEADRVAKIEADRIAKIEAEAKKGDSEKMKDLLTDLEGLKMKYTFDSSENKALFKRMLAGIDEMTNWLK